LRHVAVRKILRARRQVRTLDVIVATSFTLAFIGIGLYVFVYSSDVILMEAFVWLSEALSFLGLMLAFHVAASRALSYRARYEFLRLESLTTLFAAVVAMGMTGLVVYKAVAIWDVKPTPILLSAYPLASALTSYILERRLSRAFRRVELRLVSIKAVARKLSLDVVFEAAGGAAIIASNLLHNILAEKAIVLATAAYVYYGLSGLAYEATLYLLGVGPPSAIRRTRRDVERVVRRFFGRPPTLMRVETFGSFSEVEVWVEASPTMSLESAHTISMSVAREIVRRVPEVIRAIVIVVPWSRPLTPRPRPPLARGVVGSKVKRPRALLTPRTMSPRRRRAEGSDRQYHEDARKPDEAAEHGTGAERWG
jgi:divalent metal cation (Fe/Co/Zn/Cd) transporter